MPTTTHGDSYTVFRLPPEGATDWAFEFDYLDKTSVRVRYLNDAGQLVPVAVSAANFITASALRITPPIPTPVAVEVYRVTSFDRAPADFGYGGTRAKDNILGDALRQQLHYIEEMVDVPYRECLMTGGVPTEVEE
jgi:hypothetical protein